MTSRESAASVIVWKTDHLKKTKDALAYLKLDLDMAMDENKPTKCRGRARGIIAVWEEGRREKLQINNYLLPGCGRAEILQILTDIATGMRPGNRSSKACAEALEESPCTIKSTRTHWIQAGPHPQEGESPQRQPVSWPKCLGRGFCIEPSLPMPIAPPLLPVPSPDPSSNSDKGSYGLPSLESITGPDSSYESSTSSGTDQKKVKTNIQPVPIILSSF